MRTTRPLILLLFMCAICMQAEPASPASDKDHQSETLATMQGCLHIDSSQYILTEANGTSHLLSGAAKQLGRLVRHEVELWGKPGIRSSDATTVGGGSSVTEYVVFEVKTVKELAPQCKSPDH